MPKLRKQKKSPIAGHSREYIASRIMRGRALDRGYSLSEMARKRRARQRHCKSKMGMGWGSLDWIQNFLWLRNPLRAIRQISGNIGEST